MDNWQLKIKKPDTKCVRLFYIKLNVFILVTQHLALFARHYLIFFVEIYFVIIFPFFFVVAFFNQLSITVDIDMEIFIQL